MHSAYSITKTKAHSLVCIRLLTLYEEFSVTAASVKLRHSWRRWEKKLEERETPRRSGLEVWEPGNQHPDQCGGHRTHVATEHVTSWPSVLRRAASVKHTPGVEDLLWKKEFKIAPISLK